MKSYVDKATNNSNADRDTTYDISIEEIHKMLKVLLIRRIFVSLQMVMMKNKFKIIVITKICLLTIVQMVKICQT